MPCNIQDSFCNIHIYRCNIKQTKNNANITTIDI